MLNFSLWTLFLNDLIVQDAELQTAADLYENEKHLSFAETPGFSRQGHLSVSSNFQEFLLVPSYRNTVKSQFWRGTAIHHRTEKAVIKSQLPILPQTLYITFNKSFNFPMP